MTTMAEMLTGVRQRLDEASSGFWTDPMLRRWIMEGARDVARRAEVLQTTDTVTVIANTQNYACPTDVVRVYRAEYVQTGDTFTYPLDYQDYNNMDQIWWTGKTNSPGTPAYFTFWGYPPNLQITLYPTPGVGGTVTLYYYKLPADIAYDGTQDANTVELPQGWEDIVQLFCEYTALRRDSDPRWQEAKSIYEERLGEMIDVTRRWTDQAGLITNDVAPYVPSWLWMGD